MYFGQRGANPQAICCMIAEGALVLGTRRTLIAEQDGWWYVCGDLDWLKVPSVEGVGPTTAFETIWPFPEAGEKAFRWEVFCRVFSLHAFSASGLDIYSVAGEIPSPETIQAEITRLGKWQRVIGFVFNHDAAQQTPPADAPKASRG